MRRATYPTTDELRELVLSRANKFAAAKDISLQTLGQRIAKDNRLLLDLKDGRNITFQTYERVMSYLDANGAGA